LAPKTAIDLVEEDTNFAATIPKLVNPEFGIGSGFQIAIDPASKSQRRQQTPRGELTSDSCTTYVYAAWNARTFFSINFSFGE